MTRNDQTDERTRIGNTPTCEDCDQPIDRCTCGEDEQEPRITTVAELLREEAKRVGFTN